MASSGALEEPAKSRGSFRTSVLGTGGRTESFVPLYRLERSVQLKRRLPPPLLQTGLASLQGVRDGARGWREKGKSLGGRRAGPAASPSRDSRLSACSLCAWLGLGRALRRDPRPSLGAPLLLRPRARRGAARRSYAGRRSLSERLGLWRSFAAQSGQRTGGEGRGKRGHTLAAARAHCTLAAARSRRGASGASLAPRLRHRHLPTLRAAPDPAPGSQTPRPLVCTAPPSPVGSNNIPITCGLWSNWSRKRRRPKAARVR